MFEDLLPSGDALRHIDPRYEPLDPVFDLDEPELLPEICVKRRRKLPRAVAKTDPKAKAME